MVLDKFKDFVKSEDEEEGEKGKFGTKRGQERPPNISRDNKRSGNRGPEKPLSKGSQRSAGESRKRNEDLSMPSERDMEDLPELPGGSSEERGSRRTGSRGSRPSPGSEGPQGGPTDRRNPPGGRNERRTGGTPSSPNRPTGGGRNETLNQSQALQRILDKLDRIDRKLDRIQSRR